METQSLPAGTLEYSPRETAELARQWTKAMWNSDLWQQVYWLGVPVWQWPTDLVLMQELIAKLRPNRIVETGLALGGSAVFYSSILQMLGIDGRVISIDIRIHPTARKNIEASAFRDRIDLIEGDSKSEAVHQKLRGLLDGEKNVLVCLDSDHSYQHTLGELGAFSRYIPVDGYMVLFDTICTELADTPKGQRYWTHNSPMPALEEFLAGNPNFRSEPEWGKFMVTFAPKGFLRRTS